MVNVLTYIHATIGGVGLIAFLWVLIELLDPTETRIRRAKAAAVIGLSCLFISWVTGGYYYVNVYGSDIKPIIKAGDLKWVHSVVMETKEHVFLFLPLLAILTTSLIFRFGVELVGNRNINQFIILLSGLICLLGFLIAGMGEIISWGYLSVLESGHI